MTSLTDSFSEPKYKPAIADFIVIILIAILAVSVSIQYVGSPESNDLVAKISENGKVSGEYFLNDLNKPIEISIETNGTSTIIILEKTRARIASSSCPDQVCVNTGWLTAAGQSSACVPNRVILTLSGSDSGFDSISR